MVVAVAPTRCTSSIRAAVSADQHGCRWGPPIWAPDPSPEPSPPAARTPTEGAGSALTTCVAAVALARRQA